VSDQAYDSTFQPTAVGVTKVGTLSLLQMQNQQYDAALRIGLPVLAYLTWRGHHTIALAALVGAGVLWGNRLLGLNL
jgi:hypothetical protein